MFDCGDSALVLLVFSGQYEATRTCDSWNSPCWLLFERSVSVSCLTQGEWHGGAVASAVVLGLVPSVLRLPPGCPVSLW